MIDRTNSAWDATCAKLLNVARLVSIPDAAAKKKALDERASTLTDGAKCDLLLAWDLHSALEGGGVLSDEERLVLLDLCPERRAAWDKLLAKVRDDNTNNAEFQALHCALLLPGLLKKRRGATEADSVLYYLAQRFDLSPITQRGPAVGESWFAVGRTFGEHRANEVLRNYLEASLHDPDAWDALHVIETRLHRERQPFPNVLADWRCAVNADRQAPPRHRGGPPYANQNRDLWISYAASVLRFLGMTRDDAFDAIALAINKDESRTRGRKDHVSRETIKTAVRNFSNQVPRPCECWQPKQKPRCRR